MGSSNSWPQESHRLFWLSQASIPMIGNFLFFFLTQTCLNSVASCILFGLLDIYGRRASLIPVIPSWPEMKGWVVFVKPLIVNVCSVYCDVMLFSAQSSWHHKWEFYFYQSSLVLSYLKFWFEFNFFSFFKKFKFTVWWLT